MQVDGIEPLEGYDRVETAIVGGWRCIVPKGQFHKGSIGIYFEIDSLVPSDNPAFAFMEKRHYKVKTQKMCKSISQGLLMAPEDFGWHSDYENFAGESCAIESDYDGKLSKVHFLNDDTRFLTKILKITYAEAEDNERKGMGPDKYKKMAQQHPNLFKKPWARWLMRYKLGREIMYCFFGKKKTKATAFPTCFENIKKTDQERVENMPWVLNDKTPYIRTQKCDGSSATYILAKSKTWYGKINYEFYVCSRNVRMLNPEQECFYGAHNYYWEVAKKYDIEAKLKDYLIKNPQLDYICWQGEICAPSIQKNPHNLEATHFYCFHMIDSERGKYDIRVAEEIWHKYFMEVVPIEKELYILPDTMEEFKKTADGFYDSDACEGWTKQPREGFVYYKSDDPNFSFKNVSRQYLLNH